MPVLSARRQAEPPSNEWFQCAPVAALVEAVQREAIPELIRVYGHDGLYLRAGGAIAETLSGNMLANVLSICRDDGAWSGHVRCADDALPLLGASQSLVYASFVMETASDSPALASEVARVLKPEGVLLLLTLNPWCPMRWRWTLNGVRSRSMGYWHAQLRKSGLEIERTRLLGPIWMGSDTDVMAPDTRVDWLRGLRFARLTVARRRDVGVMPLRWASPAVGYGQGVGAN